MIYLHEKRKQISRIINVDQAGEAKRSYDWARRHMEDIGGMYPNKWIGIKGERVVAVRDSEAELERAVEPLIDKIQPISIFRILKNPDPKTENEVRQNPLAFGVTYYQSSDGDIERVEQPPLHEHDVTEDSCASEVIDRLKDLRYRSVSFDLHSTLLLPRGGLNDVVYSAFKSVLIDYGFSSTVDILNSCFGENAAEQVASLSTVYYRRADSLLESMPDIFQHPAPRWVMANNYTIVHLIVGDPDHVGLVIRKLGNNDIKLGTKRLIAMGREVQKRISGSRPEAWYFTAEQKGIVDAAIERGILISILSNGTQSSVIDCAKCYFPEIPAWQIFTPKALKDTGKPSLVNSALFLLSLGCAIVRNAMEGRPAPEEIVRSLPKQSQLTVEKWRKARAYVVNRVYEEVTNSQKTNTAENTLGVIRVALREFCTRVKMPDSVSDSLAILPHQHLHVGNSGYHDSLPDVGLGLPFDYILYTAKDNEKESIVNLEE